MKREWLAVFLYFLFGLICLAFLLDFLPSSWPLVTFLVVTGIQAIFTVLHAESLLGPRRFFLLVVLTLFLTFLAEWLGSRFGLLFGQYHYTGALGPQVLGVPLVIPLAWLTMLYPSWLLARMLIGPKRESLWHSIFRASLGGVLMVGWDLVLDPALSTASGFWVWESGGGYGGVPLTNFFSWWAVSFLVLLLFELLSRASPKLSLQRGKRPFLLPFLLYLANMLYAAALCFQGGLALAGWVGLGWATLVVVTILTHWFILSREKPPLKTPR
ncbi:MAG: carotenoid biosynthesis protein [bacterium]